MHDFIAIDVETTGYKAGRDRVWEVGIVSFQGGASIRSAHWTINPGMPIPPDVIERCGLMPHDLEAVARAPEWSADVARSIWDHIAPGTGGRSVVVAHNAGFEKRMLTAEFEAAGLPGWPPGVDLVCTMNLARAACRREGVGASLGEALAVYGVHRTGPAHLALPDARVTGLLYMEIQRREAADKARAEREETDMWRRRGGH